MRRITTAKFDQEANTAASIEDAYRRGVHQALGALQFFLEETGADISEVLPLAVKRASAIRGSEKDAPFLLDGLFDGVKADMAKAAKGKVAP